jgi:SagB-type dehydrogenase family enzyme
VVRHLTVKSSTRLRRARTIVGYWQGEQFVIENYRTGVCITADPLAVKVLHFFKGWRSIAAFCRCMPKYTTQSITSVLRDLVYHTLLLRKGSEEARRDARLQKVWSSWLPHAGFFHFGTRDIQYENKEHKIKQMLRKFLADSRQPSFFKHYYQNPSFPLPRVAQPKTELLRTLLRRRTHRQFSKESLSLQSLSQLLFYAWGVTSHLDVPLLRRLPLKTSPSAGARHPTEVYVLALRVQGLPAGLYHYAPDLHALQQLHVRRPEKKAVAYCGGQSWVRKAAALFVMTAVFPRVMWKYRTSRAYRTVLVDSGHLCQTFCLVATWLRLAPFCTLALKDSAIEKDLDLDGISESVIYVAGVGLPRRGARAPFVVPSRLLASL